MLNSIELLQELLSATFLSEADIISLEIPMTTNLALAIHVNLENSFAAWQLLLDLLPQTQRYPVISTCWGLSTGGWEKAVKGENFFSRFFFNEEYAGLNLSPEQVIAKANAISQEELDKLLHEKALFNTYNLETQILDELAQTQLCFDVAPVELDIKEQVQSGAISTIVDIEKYLFDWELQHKSEAKPETSLYFGYLDWYEPTEQTIVLILFPTAHSWETLAYLSWYGGSRLAIPLIKRWHQKYEAELVYHYGTMLQFLVNKKPSNPQEAFELASQQVLLAPCTTMLSGISIRDHARSLLEVDRWFIHERP